MKVKGVKPPDIMTSVRRLERKGLVYVRGYGTGRGETPFKEDFHLDCLKTKRRRIEGAIRRTERALVERSNSSQVMQRIQIVRDQ